MTPKPTPPRPWRKQKNGTLSQTDKAPATLKLTLPSDMPSPDKPWMERLQRIERPPPPYVEEPIKPKSIIRELKHSNASLRSDKDDVVRTQHLLGTAPAPGLLNTGDIATLRQAQAFNQFRQTPAWSAKKVLAARATSAFLDKQYWLWDKVDESSCAARKRALIVDIAWACKEMDRRHKEFCDEVEALEKVGGGVDVCEKKACT